MTRTHLCCLVVATIGGCIDRPALARDPRRRTTAAAPATFDRKPEILLSSRKPDRLIVAIDFAGSRAMDKSVPLDERRRYVLEQAGRPVHGVRPGRNGTTSRFGCWP